MLVELPWFVALALLRIPRFRDRVLLWFAAGPSLIHPSVLTGIGSAWAGVAAVVDVVVFGTVGRRWRLRPKAESLPCAGRGFYVADLGER